MDDGEGPVTRAGITQVGLPSLDLLGLGPGPEPRQTRGDHPDNIIIALIRYVQKSLSRKIPGLVTADIDNKSP